jgi:UDP-glucuronate 4-epimerase
VRLVVTGAAGFIGSRLCLQLLREGHQVVGIDRLGADRLETAWTGLQDHPQFRGVAADLLDFALTDLLLDADAAVHLAGRPGMRDSWDQLPGYLRDNVEVSAVVAKAALDAFLPRLIHASSSSVYGSVVAGDEHSPLVPVSPYGATKLAAESVLRAYAASYGLPITILRLFSVYGPGQRPDMGVYRAIHAALTGATFQQYGDGRQTRSMTHVDDVVDGIIQALHAPTGGTYNLAGGVSVSMLEVLERIDSLVGARAATQVVADPPGNQRHTDADLTLAARDLGYQPKVTLREGLRSQVAWHQDMLTASRRKVASGVAVELRELRPVGAATD